MTANRPPVPGVSILVVSCDKYADLWDPFFALFRQRWPDCPYPVFLGSNFKRFEGEGVTTLAIGEDVAWGAGLLRMLDGIPTSHVILLLEDFFLKATVDTAAIARLAGIAAREGVGCLRLSPLPPPTPPPSVPIGAHPELGEVERGTPYRIATQPAIWRADWLRRLIEPGYSAWEFEHLATRASEAMPEAVWAPFRPTFVYDQVVEKGKWKPEGLDICREAGVTVDLAARGAFTRGELSAYFEDGARKDRLPGIERRAVAAFLAGRRSEGARAILRLFRDGGGGARALAILAAGLLGPGTLARLRERHLARRIEAVRKDYAARLARKSG